MAAVERTHQKHSHAVLDAAGPATGGTTTTTTKALKSQDSSHDHHPPSSILNLLNLLVFFDMLGVALVVPLMQEYFKTAGFNAAYTELSSSLFSISQIVGGLGLGIAADADLLTRKQVLLLSFSGSSISYALVGLSRNPWPLVVSRLIVGLVKQTMTVTTAIVAEQTSEEVGPHPPLLITYVYASVPLCKRKLDLSYADRSIFFFSLSKHAPPSP